jgi:hypothetical protein
MLAWLHQICPGEAENITQLLKLCDKVSFYLGIGVRSLL